MESFRVALIPVCFPKTSVGNLRGRVAAAAIYLECGHLGDTIFPLPNRSQRFLEAETERAYNPGRDDRHAGAISGLG